MSTDAIGSAILLTEVPARITGNPHINTIRRWAGRGVHGIRLQSWLIGGRRYTSAEAIDQFVRDLNGRPHDTQL